MNLQHLLVTALGETPRFSKKYSRVYFVVFYRLFHWKRNSIVELVELLHILCCSHFFLKSCRRFLWWISYKGGWKDGWSTIWQNARWLTGLVLVVISFPGSAEFLGLISTLKQTVSGFWLVRQLLDCACVDIYIDIYIYIALLREGFFAGLSSDGILAGGTSWRSSKKEDWKAQKESSRCHH